MKKSITVQTTVEKDGQNIAYMSCQIGCSIDMFNISMQVINKKLYEENKSLVAEKANEFFKESLSEAIANGWDILKQ